MFKVTSELRGIKRGLLYVNGEWVDAKQCTECSIARPLNDFTPKSDMYDGRINKCKPCTAERQVRYAKERPDIRRKAERNWRTKNPEKVKEMARRSRKRNIEGYRERLRKWREKNPEREREIRRRYVENNPEAVRESKRRWAEKNKDKRKIYSAIRRARIKKLPFRFDSEWADLLLIVYGGCILTGEKENIHWDHFIPVAAGKGGTTYGNMVPLRDDLNQRKSAKNPIDFLLNEGMSYEKLYDILFIMSWLNDMSISDYIDYVYDCFDEKEGDDNESA